MNSRVVLLLSIAATASCDRGSRTLKSCPDTQKDCDGTCRTLTSDDANCGACGVACANGSRCTSGQCHPAQCSDAMPCATNHVCVAGRCLAGSCVGVTCAATETCVNGACLPQDCATRACPTGFACVGNACAEATCFGVTCPQGQQCRGGFCTATACTDGVQNGTETGVDCGGSCPKCGDHGACLADGDCQSGTCSNGLCLSPSCADQTRNQDETGVDCGGATCPRCAQGQACAAATDCASASCANHVCQASACDDGVKNGNETDTDCGGACPGCATSRACLANGDCGSGLCVTQACVAKPTLSIPSTTSGDEGANIPLAVTLSAAVGVDVTFAYATSDGTARAGTDFTGASATGTIPAGGTSATLAIATTARALYQGDRAFTVTLSTPTNAALANASATVTIRETAAAPPTSLAYSPSSTTCTRGQACALGAPTGGGVGSAYGVSPALPAGLSLDATTGAISGTPTVLSGATSYTVTAANSGGSATATVTITVSDGAPAIAYSPSAVVCTVNSACAFAAPTSTGGAVGSFAAPGLPAGMSINTVTGAISGTPTSLSPATACTITATNSAGSASATVTITVKDRAPAIAYSPATATCAVKSACAFAAPTSTGGAVVSFAAPGLPAGMSINTATGAISGTPTLPSTATIYTVTATNSAGSASATVTITVNNVAPSISYSPSTKSCAVNTACTFAAPNNVGGPVVSFTAPVLPAGMSINAATGALSGAPTSGSSATTYTITATNAVGSGTATVTITVSQAAPNITLYPSDLSCSLNQPCGLGAPVNTGGPIASLTLFGALPAGLSFDAATGIISGTPAEVWTVTSYNVTATNAVGSSTVHVTIEVINQGEWALWPIPDEKAIYCSDGSNPSVCPTVGTATYGQDGNYLINVPTYTVDAVKGTVQDAVTGLMWEKTVDARAFSQAGALAYCRGLTQGGYSGWRLPTRIELQSLVDYGRYNPAIDTGTFQATPATAFWTASVCAGLVTTNTAWSVDFTGGIVQCNALTNLQRVRCVR